MEEVRVSRLPPSLARGSSLLPLQPTGLINGSKDKRDSFVPIRAINSPKFSILKASSCVS